MKLTLPQNIIRCSLNEYTIDPFILVMSLECYQSHDQEVFLLPAQINKTETLDADLV